MAEDNLKKLLSGYTNRLRSSLRASHQVPVARPLRLVTNRAMFRELLDDLESGPKFQQLVRETKSAFSSAGHTSNESAWHDAVKNFFRRSGYYLTILNGNAVDDEEILIEYRKAFANRQIEVTYLAPLEFVKFGELFIKLGAFQIKRFGAQELRQLVRNDVNEVFYPWAAIDVDRLEGYWFLQVVESATAPALGHFTVDLSSLSRVENLYTPYPKSVELAVQQLALFGWEAVSPFGSTDERETPWLRFRIPFVLTLDDNLLDWPRRAPNLSGLVMEPVVDPMTGKEIGVEPLFHIILDEAATDSFKAFLNRAGSLLAHLRSPENKWHFVEIALGNLVKAFSVEGLEQLLWHITVLEALLGEKDDEVVERLARRIARILGSSENARKNLRKEFKELYDFRSDLVHGNLFEKQVSVGHLRRARSLARRILLWFLQYLQEIEHRVEKNILEGPADRREILRLIDLDRVSRSHLSSLAAIVPEGFPYVPEWSE